MKLYDRTESKKADNISFVLYTIEKVREMLREWLFTETIMHQK